ncbi:hypothetical protein K7432_001724 [Basidiobolus ranarum]|uniref:DUF1308 domain-containing protein n=1 Tax=Basidiobolus ranarum TaxID=34480 RepID=A0ABR2X2K0_9FUNG
MEEKDTKQVKGATAEVTLNKLREQAVELLKAIRPYDGKVEGIHKLERGILAEQNFLQKSTIEQSELNSTNLKYYSAIVETLKSSNSPTSVLKVFRYQSTQCKFLKRVIVDVVTDNGTNWIKVSKLYKRGSNKIPLDSDYSDAEDSFLHLRDSPLIKYARKMIEASKQNLIHFNLPKITFTTCEDMDNSLIMRLKEEGVFIEKPHEFFPSSISASASDMHPSYCSRLNLDVTSLIALVSDLTHSLKHPVDPTIFKEQPLIIQATQELAEPILPIFSKLFHDRTLHTTRSAYSKFFELINLIAGERETIRAHQIFTKELIDYNGSSELYYNWREVGFNEPPYVTVIEDQPSPRFLELLKHPNKPKKFTSLTMVVFGTGDQLKMTTVSGNSWISRSLDQMELKNRSVFEHSPRSLVEKKSSQHFNP